MNTDYAVSGGDTTTGEAGQFDQVDWETYDTGSATGSEGGTKFQLPEDGVYTFRIPTITEADFKKGDLGQLKVTVSPLTIVGGQHNGYELKFYTTSNKRYSNRNASGLGDLLLGANSTHRPTSEEAWKMASKALAGRTIQAKARWEGYNKFTKAEFVGMNAFPVVNGARQSFIDFNAETNEAITAAEAKELGRDRTYRVWANLKIARILIPGK